MDVLLISNNKTKYDIFNYLLEIWAKKKTFREFTETVRDLESLLCPFTLKTGGDSFLNK